MQHAVNAGKLNCLLGRCLLCGCPTQQYYVSIVQRSLRGTAAQLSEIHSCYDV